MMTRWAWGGGMAGALAAVVVWAPAHWLTRQVEQLSQQRVMLQHAQGSVWSGSAQLVLSAGVGSQQAVALPDRLTWHLRPSLLPRPSLNLTLSLPCCTPTPMNLQALVDWSGTRMRVLDQQSTWPADALAGLGTPGTRYRRKGSCNWTPRRWKFAGPSNACK